MVHSTSTALLSSKDSTTHSTALPQHFNISTALHSTALHSTALHSTALHSTALHSTALHSTALHSTALHSTALQHFHSTSLHSTSEQQRLHNTFHSTPTTLPQHFNISTTLLQHFHSTNKQQHSTALQKISSCFYIIHPLEYPHIIAWYNINTSHMRKDHHWKP